MSDTLDLDDIDESLPKPDFQRANGAPMVVDKNGKRIRLSRPSNYAKPLDDESALTNWRIDTACVGVAHDRALQAQYVALDFDDRDTRKALREKATQAGRGNEGSDIGTALHAMSERWEKDEKFSPPSPYLESLEAYSAEMERLGLESVAFEQPVVNLEHGAAGTFDRLWRTTRVLFTPDGEIIPVGTDLIGDLKTNKRLDYSVPSYAVQMALYAGGEFYDVVSDEFLETPTINQDWAILMWMPSDNPGECVAFWVDLRVGREGIQLARAVKAWRKMWRSGEYSLTVVPEPGIAQDAAIELAVKEFGAEVITVEEADDEIAAWMTMMTGWAQERINAIRHHDKAKFQLTTFWPDGVPTPKQGITQVGHMTALLDHLDNVEATHSLPFVPRPGIEGGHKDRINTTNNPPSKEES